jgi:hypothetical protein
MDDISPSGLSSLLVLAKSSRLITGMHIVSRAPNPWIMIKHEYRWLTRHSVGNKNKDCLCATCERKGRGGYAPQSAEGEEDTRGDQVARYMAESSDEEAPGEKDEDERVNVHERRTRRGVYHVSPEREEADVKEESEDEEPRAGAHACVGILF